MEKQNDRIYINIARAEDGVEAPLWKKALAYYKERKVGKIYQLGPNSFSCSVKGNNYHPYNVTLSIINGNISSHTCDCEAHKRYPGPCKHVLALLIKLSEEKGMTPEIDESFDQIDEQNDGFYSDIPANDDY